MMIAGSPAGRRRNADPRTPGTCCACCRTCCAELLDLQHYSTFSRFSRLIDDSNVQSQPREDIRANIKGLVRPLLNLLDLLALLFFIGLSPAR
jgi:hypothetical protein